MKKNIILKPILKTVFCFFFIISCTTQKKSEQGVGTPHLSKDDKTLYFQYFNGMNGSICKMNITDSVFKQISPIANEFTFYNPRLTEDEKNIVFVGRRIGTDLSTIFISDGDSSSIKSLFTTESVYDAFLSKNKAEIIYAKPDTIANYSPIARKAEHGYDIFSFILESKKISKLTNFHSYSIDGISDYKKDSLLYTDEDKEGICAIARNNPTNPRIIIRNNDSNNMHHLYIDPVYDEKYNVFVFHNSYEICIMNAKKQIKRIYLSKQMIGSFCVFHTLPRILFTVEGESCFYSINFDGTDLKKKEVHLPAVL